MERGERGMFKQKKLLLVGIVLVLIVSGFFIYNQINDQKSDRILNKIVSSSLDNLLEDTLQMLETESSSSLYLIKDASHYIHFIMLDSNELLADLKIPAEIGNSSDLELTWSAKHINSEKKYAFFGVIYNKNIARITVNNSEVNTVDYQGHRVFYSTEKFDSPIFIRGYSPSGDLIYSNDSNDKNDMKHA